MRVLIEVFVLLFAINAAVGQKVTSMEESIYNVIFGASGTGNFIPGDGKPMDLSAHFGALHYHSYDEKKGLLDMSYYLSLSWKLPGATWDPKKYNGIKSIKIPASKIWVPDMVPYTHAGLNSHDYRAVLMSDGTVLWIPHVFASLSCEDIHDGPNYPYDEKICVNSFGPWTHSSDELNLTLALQPRSYEIQDTSLQATGWKHKNSTVERVAQKYEGFPQEYHSLKLKITIQRRDVYYGLAVSAPAIVVGFITALLYLVPPASPARVTSQTICLLIIVFVGVTDIRMMGSTVRMAPAVHFFIGAMVLDLLAIIWSILMAALWMQESINSEYSAPKRAGCFEPILSRLECLCCLPNLHIQHDHQRLDLQEDNKDSTENAVPIRVVGLSGLQRVGLLMDRLFCLSTFVLILFLFISVGS